MSLRRTFRFALGKAPFLDGVFRRFIWSRVHFPEVEMRFINSLESRAIDVAFDVGAATGSYAWILNRKSRDVYAFEPGQAHADELSRASFSSRIHVVRKAVGDACRTVPMFTPGEGTEALHSATLSRSNPVIRSSETRTREVEQTTLDYYYDNEIEKTRCVDLVKVDVEGYELEVLKGAQVLIARFHPLIFCEIERRHNDQCMEIFRNLRSIGYRSYIFSKGAFEVFEGDDLDFLQQEAALQKRLSGDYDLLNNQYVNNFVFQHDQSKLKVAP